MERYLDGITVLDLTQYLAGPACTRLLREMGADVIKVERAPYGDPTRSFVPRANRRSGFHVQQNRGKRSICLDWTKPETNQIISDLAAEVDVLVENFSPGTLERRGLDYPTLKARNPRLIYASISGFGQTGPLRDKVAFDFIAQAYAGVMHMNGDPDGPPLFVGVALADSNVGVHAFAGIGYALFRRGQTGAGTHIDCSMVDSLVHMQEYGITGPSVPDSELDPQRQGRYYQTSQPGAVYRTGDGWVVLIAADHQLAALWEAMGQPELGEDERFTTNRDRLAHREELTGVIEAWTTTLTTDQVVALLEAHRVPCSRVLSPAELRHEEHLRARGTIRDVTDPLVGEVVVPGFPIAFSDAPDMEDGVAPDLGQHNGEVLWDLLGYERSRVEQLTAAGVLFSKDR